MFFFLIYILVLWLTNGLLFFHKMSLDYQSVVDYYLGSPDKYTQPKSYQGLLEVSHWHFFAMGILILTLTHLLLFVPLNIKLKIILIFVSFSSAFLDEASGWLIRYLHPNFAYLKIFAFLSLEFSLLAIIILVTYALYSKKPSSYLEGMKN